MSYIERLQQKKKADSVNIFDLYLSLMSHINFIDTEKKTSNANKVIGNITSNLDRSPKGALPLLKDTFTQTSKTSSENILYTRSLCKTPINVKYITREQTLEG